MKSYRRDRFIGIVCLTVFGLLAILFVVLVRKHADAIYKVITAGLWALTGIIALVKLRRIMEFNMRRY